MKTPHSTLYRFTAEAVAHANRIPAGTVSEQAHKRGMESGDALIVALDCLLKIAEAHAIRFESKMSEDYVLGPEWLAAAKGLRGLLNGNAELANRKDISTDTKDNGACEALFWDALNHAGFTEADL